MKKIILLTVLAVCVAISACHKDQPEMNAFNQGCETAKEVTAEFTIVEAAGSSNSLMNKLTESDTVYTNKPIWFTAQEDSAEYKWYIGAEVVTEQRFYRTFDNSLVGQTLPMHLVVKKKPNLICNPTDDGYDSITKYITIMDIDEIFTMQNRFDGTYRLCDSATTDSIDVVVDFDENYLNTYGPKILFYNIGLWNNGDEVACNLFGLNYKQVWCGGAGCFQRANFSYGDKNNVDLRVEGAGFSQCSASYHFRGRKLN